MIYREIITHKNYQAKLVSLTGQRDIVNSNPVHLKSRWHSEITKENLNLYYILSFVLYTL